MRGYSERTPNQLFVRGDSLYAVYDRAVLTNSVAALLADVPTYAKAEARTIEIAGVERSVGDGSVIRVRANGEALRVRMVAPVYGRSPAPRFRYRVREVDERWGYVSGADAEVYVASLPPGRFTLEYGLAAAGAPLSRLPIEGWRPWYAHPLSWLLTGLLAFAGLGVAVTRRTRRVRRDLSLHAELRRSRLAAIAAQMNPHFLYNAINSVQQYTLNRDGRAANAYLSRFASLMRLTLAHSRVEDVSLRDEVEAIRLYADLEGRRFDGLVDVTIAVSPELPHAARIPPLLIQPHLENAFKHGMAGRTSPGGMVDVQYLPAGRAGVLRAIVTDNGVGRAAAAARADRRPRPSSSFGTDAARERVDLLCQARPDAVHVAVEDLLDEGGRAAGTRVILDIAYSVPTAAAQRADSPFIHS